MARLSAERPGLGYDPGIGPEITGRFAPSPTGPLHLGNLRTALLAWCSARADGGAFLLRVEDLTTGAAPTEEARQVERGQVADLDALGLSHDGPITRQSERAERYRAAIDELTNRALTYPCFCSRREIREAAAAPHGPFPEGSYPGTCRSLDDAAVAERLAGGATPALRLNAGASVVAVTDRRFGVVTAVVDDFVLCRADGVAAYNLAVVIDDADQGVDQVVRGADLLSTTPRQVMLQRLLELPTPAYAHVPLVLGRSGDRLAKRDGAVTLADRRSLGETPSQVIGQLAASVGLAAVGESVDAESVLRRFDPDALPLEPWTWVP